MKIRIFILALAATAAIASGPQLAHASCGGDACNFISFDGKTLTNKDPQLKIAVGACRLDAKGICDPRMIFVWTVDPKTSQTAKDAKYGVEVRSAYFKGVRPVLVDKVTVTNGGQVPLRSSSWTWGASISGAPPTI